MDRARQVLLGEVAIESTGRAGCNIIGSPVFGVDKNVGITTEPRYQSNDLSRYKIIKPGMFGYNPMRLNIGSIGFCTERHGMGLISPDYVVFECDDHQLLPEFFYYHTCSPLWKSWLELAGEGSVRERIYFRKLANYSFTLPPLSYQGAAVSILSAIDNKIELNLKTNATLEETAQAIFKDWFIDFGPSRSKIEGLEPYLTPEVWSLFPSTLDADGKPEGWSFPMFDDLVIAKQGKYLAKNEMQDLKSEDFPHPVWGGNGILGYTINKYYKEPITLMTCRGSNCGLIRLTESSSWVSNNSFACSPKIGSTFFIYVYFCLESFLECISGSAQPQITYTSLKNKRMKFPIQEKVCESFLNIMEPIFQQIFSNNRESQSLAQTRDLILPKLMSGDIGLAFADLKL